MKKIITPFLIAFGASLAGIAQDSLKTTKLEEVVVTGQYEPQSLSKSVYKVRVIPQEVIQARGALKLQDVLNSELNIRFNQDLATGSTNISMQGMPGQNVKVLIDGVPIVGKQGVGNDINLNQVNVASIERIEIIEGPMAVVYGPDALAGVINIITKKSQDGKWDATAKVHEETVGKEYGGSKGIHNETIGIGYSKGTFYTRGDFSRNNFGGWTGTATGREKLWNPKTQWLTSATAGIKGDRYNLYYRLDYLNEDIYNPAEYEGNEALDQDYITNRWMHQVQGNYTFSDKVTSNLAVAYTDYKRQTQSVTVNKTSGDIRLATGPGLQDITAFNGITVRHTYQVKVSDRFTIQPGLDINNESGSGGRIAAGTHAIGDYAAFVSGEWKISKWMQVRPGVRVVHNTAYAAPPALPALNLKFVLSEEQDLRLSYARGFRAPSLRELYFSFFDSNHNIEGNTDLKAETSHSFNGSWNWKVIHRDGLHLATVFGGFYNNSENLIDYLPKASDPRITTLVNISKYKTRGVTWSNTLKFAKVDVTAGAGYTGRYNVYYATDNQSKPFTWSPEVNGTVNYKLSKQGMNFSFFYKFTGRTPQYQLAADNTIQLAKISPYSWADVSVQKTLLGHITLNSGVHNLFNVTLANSTVASTGAHSTSGPLAIGSGRSYYLSLLYSLNKL